MRKQIFEVLPPADELPGLYQILRYENASQRAEISAFEGEIARLKATIDELEEKLAAQQQVIDDFNAELRALRINGR